MKRRLLELAFLGTLAGVSAGFQEDPGAAAGSQVVASEPQRSSAEEAAIRLLRSLRRKDRPADDVLVTELSVPGERLLPLLFQILVRRAVPALDGGEEQVLSEIQEEILLRTLGSYDRDSVLTHVEAALAGTRDLRLRHAALQAIGRAGRANDLPQMFELACAADEVALDRRLATSLERAVTALALHDPHTYEQLVALRRITRPELLPSLIDGVGATRDPRALKYLGEVLYWADALALDVMSQVPRLGASGDPELDEPVRVRLRPFLSAERPEHCRAAITALVGLGDLESIPALIDLLGGEDRGLVQNAHWGLKELTGLSYSPEAQAWARWHQGELSWCLRSKTRELVRLQRGDAAEASDALRTLLVHPLARAELCLALPELLKSRHPGLRALACTTLADLGVGAATEKLVWALEDDFPEVRQAAHAALRRLTNLDLPLEPVAWQSATHSEPRGTEL